MNYEFSIKKPGKGAGHLTDVFHEHAVLAFSRINIKPTDGDFDIILMKGISKQ
jgi:hypothetical protein